jgi:hypothetical protein
LKLKEYWGKDINFFLSFIIGLGNETPQDIMDTHKWCIENGVSSWIFHPLSMSRHPDVIFPSVFDLNYTNYGYRFPDPLDDYYWENDTWNFKSAKEFVEPLSQIIHKEEKPASFFLASLASTTGKSFDELINTTRKELDWYNIKITIESFLQEYAEQNLKQ